MVRLSKKDVKERQISGFKSKKFEFGNVNFVIVIAIFVVLLVFIIVLVSTFVFAMKIINIKLFINYIYSIYQFILKYKNHC